jgi:hypothetical protein
MQLVSEAAKYNDAMFWSATEASHGVVARIAVTNGSPGNLGDGAATRVTAGEVEVTLCTVVVP